MSTMDFFWAKVEPAGDEECWGWRGFVMPNGYGQFQRGHEHIYAHRFAYEELVGPIPDGLTIDHLCRNRACVNPAHLEPVTHAENRRRARLTHCKRGHPIDGEGTERRCKACDSIRYQIRKAKRLAA